MSVETSEKIKTSDFKIVTCKCFIDAWKKIKRSGDENWNFNEINEGKNCFKKVFMPKRILLNSCYKCMEEIIVANPFLLDLDEKGFCIVKRFLSSKCNLEEICNPCLLFFIESYEHKFNIV